jgi:hypothetical protein
MARDGSRSGGDSTTGSTVETETSLTACSSAADPHDDGAVDDGATAGALAVPPDGDPTTLRVAWSVVTQGEVAFVSVRVENETPVARRVRLRNRLDGPVMPPRSAGVPEAGWDDAGYEGVVAPGDRLALGYACPADVAEPPVDVDDRGRPAPDRESPVDAGTAIRKLGRATPPRDAVPAVSQGGVSDDPAGTRHDSADREPDPERESTAENGTRDGTERDDAERDVTDCNDAERDEPELPQAIEAWLAGAERRVERGEQLSTGSLSEATAVLTAAGGVDEVADLPGRLADDARALRALARRASLLATRAEAVDVPVESLRRLT